MGSKLIIKIFAAVVLCFSFIGVGLAKTNPTQDSAAIQLSALLNRYSTYQADFKQMTYDTRGRRMQSGEGRLKMAKPGKFRWDMTKPYEQLIITDGKTLWIYDVDLEQVTTKPVHKRSGLDPASLLTGKTADLLKQFKVSQINRRGRGTWFQLLPKKSGSGFMKVQMLFRRGELREMRVVNNLRQITDFQFSNVKLNSYIKPNLFHFKPPRGVTVIKS